MKLFKYILTPALFFLCLSCENLFVTCQEGNGKFEFEKRAVTNFTGVISSVSYSVEISYDSLQSLTVEADDNLMEYIETTVRNGNLYIETKDDECIETSGIIKVKITCPYLEKVELLGSGEIDIHGFNKGNMGNLNIALSGSGNIKLSTTVTNSIEVDLTGSGHVTLDGKANKSDYILTGSGDIDAENFTVANAFVKLSGSGDVYVRALFKLEIIITGSGDIYYYGEPELEPSPIVTGSGGYFKR